MRAGSATIRMGLALLLLGAVDAAVATGLALLFLPSLAALGIGAAVVAGQVVLAPRLALRSLGARVIGPDQEPELHGRLMRLAQHLDIPVPRLAISPTAAPVASAVGATERGAVICVSEGLRERLDPAELDAVLAHELAHVAHRDAMVMGAAAPLLTVAGLSVRLAFWDGCIERREAALLSPVTVFGMFFVRLCLIVPIAAAMLVYAVSFPAVRLPSHGREYAADRRAGILTGAPSDLASALLKVQDALEGIPTRDLRTVSLLNGLLVLPAAGPADPLIARLIATHPPVERRIAPLQSLQAQSEGPSGL